MGLHFVDKDVQVAVDPEAVDSVGQQAGRRFQFAVGAAQVRQVSVAGKQQGMRLFVAQAVQSRVQATDKAGVGPLCEFFGFMDPGSVAVGSDMRRIVAWVGRVWQAPAAVCALLHLVVLAFERQPGLAVAG